MTDRMLGRLDGSIQTLSDPDLFVLMYVRKEAVLSSQIEGTESSLTDLLRAEAEIMDGPSDVAEVISYVDAMNHGLERLRELPVSTRLVKEIHERLMRGVRGQEREPGELRRTQNWIGPPGCTFADATFVPPPPHEMVAALSELERFIHADDDMPLMLTIGLAHAQFETIHPFLDGKGRIGRLLITFLLCERGVLSKPVLYLSHYFKQQRQRYYDVLQATRDRGAWEAWLKFFLTGITGVSRAATATAREIVGLRERHRAIIQRRFGRTAANGLTVLEHLFSRPIISVQTIRELTGVSFPAASKLMDRFIECEVLIETTGQARNRRFLYTEYINLFAGPD